MTKKEYTFWLLSSIFLIIGLILVFFIKDKNESRKPLPEKFYQKKVFWAWIFIPLFVILFIYSIFLKKESPYNFMMIILVVDMIIFNYFGMKCINGR